MNSAGLNIDARAAAQRLAYRADATPVDAYVVGSTDIAAGAAVLLIRRDIDTTDAFAEIGW